MKRAIIVWSLVALFAGVLVGYMAGKAEGGRERIAPGPSAASVSGTGAMSVKAHDLHASMRKLWSDHVIWTREYIIAAATGTPVSEALVGALGAPVGSVATAPLADSAVSALSPADAAAVRLLKNQEDIGAAVAAYYGKEAGDKTTSLLKEHILIAVRLIEAAKKDDKEALAKEDAAWRKNAEDIASLLSSANPNWPKATILSMMNMHLDTTADELKARLSNNYNADVAAFDKVYDHILMMADAIAAGIIRQYPDKF